MGRWKLVFGLIGAAFLQAAVLAIVLLIVFNYDFDGPDPYSSIHQGLKIAPMMGFSDDALVNVGDGKALDQLPGVGEVIAQRIIDVREVINGYILPEDLMLVKGIGQKTLDKIMTVLEDTLVTLPEHVD